MLFRCLSPTTQFADTAAGVRKKSSLLTVPRRFKKSDIRTQRTIISDKQLVFIVPQEFDGENVKEVHVVKGVQEWLTTEDRCCFLYRYLWVL